MLEEKKLENLDPTTIVSPGAIIRIANRMLYNINRKFVIHNERTAYLALKLAQNHKMNEKCSIQNLVILALFHTIGFFKHDIYFNTNPFDSNIDIFSYDKAIESKFIFGCYYLEYLTPLKKDALALEYLNHTFDPEMKRVIYQYEYKSILFLCAKISNFIKENPDSALPEDIDSLAPGKFDPDYVKLFKELNKDNKLETAIHNGTYITELSAYIDTINFSAEDAHQYLKFLVYLLDTKSTVTYTHSINTACYAYSLGKRLNLSEKELNTLYISAILHDIGKIAIPTSILEKPAELSPDEISYMRKHVKHSKLMIEDIVSQTITNTVYRHHEKINGTGYPEKLQEEQIDILSRTLAVADIASALIDKRSYKGGYPKEKTCQIMTLMTIQGELDSKIAGIFLNDYDQIREELVEHQSFLTIKGLTEVLSRYNNYIFNDADNLIDNVVDINEVELPDAMQELYELIEELEEV